VPAVSVAQYTVLALLAVREGATASELATRVGEPPVVLAHHLCLLEHAGRVERRSGPLQDGEPVYELTWSGIAELSRACPARTSRSGAATGRVRPSAQVLRTA